MHFDHLTPLLPCRALDELTLQRKADEAEQLLSAWTALWHPAVVASARAMPRWSPAESPPSETAGYLILVPPCCEPLLPGGFIEGVESAGGSVLRGLHHRAEMTAAALALIKDDPLWTEGQVAPERIDPELAADFLALGFCHFTIELLTQHLRYMSNLDEVSFERELVAAAEHACKGETEEARARLQAAFDLLHTAREYFYPVEAHLLDLTLLASTTLGPSLRAGLAGDKPINLLVCGEVVEEMARREPESLAALRSALENSRAAILGGEYRELELPLLPPEAIRHQLREGLAAYERHLGARPTVFGRRRFGITPVLPQILEKLGFVAAMHSTLDDGKFPASTQSRVRWEGLDGTVLETMARVPSDISRADAFLRLPQQLGNSMDLDHVATVLFAHWPGRSSPWYDDLRRITRYTNVMGSFSTVTDYVQRTGMAGQQAAHKPDEYRSPYLKQAVAAGEADPLSRWARYYRRRAAAEAAEAMRTLAALVGNGHAPQSDVLLRDVDQSLGAERERNAALDHRIENELQAALGCFTRSLGAKVAQGGAGVTQGGAGVAQGGAGILVVNPCSFSRRMCLEAAELLAAPDVAGAVQQSAESGGRRTVVLEVPPLGFAWVEPGAAPSPAPPQPAKRKWGILAARAAEPPPLAQRRPLAGPARGKAVPPLEETVLRNEFFELILDPRSGAIRAVLDYQSRGPRLAQQIALRLPEARGEGDDAYSTMVADEIAITSPGPVLGEAVARGRLLDHHGRRLAGFRQTTRVWRGSRVIELDIDLDVDQLPAADPWNSYYAARFAWSDESSNLYRGVNMANVPTEAALLEAPHFLDVRLERLRTTLLTGGLPYHRRIGLRRLDTLLVVRGETARRFRLGIGIDLPHPMTAAVEFLAPRTVQPGAAPPPAPSGWLFHLDARNVVATHWEPLLEEGRAAGYRARLLETDGRPVALGLRSFRSVQSARKLAAPDRADIDLRVEGDRVAVDIDAYEWAEIEARFT